MLLVTLATITLASVLLYRSNGFVSIHFYIATALGIGAAMLLMSALVGLVFLSAGTGHDDAIMDPWRTSGKVRASREKVGTSFSR